jgi:hypothetical protein
MAPWVHGVQPKVRSEALPFYGVDTVEEAETLILALYKKTYDDLSIAEGGYRYVGTREKPWLGESHEEVFELERRFEEVAPPILARMRERRPPERETPGMML